MALHPQNQAFDLPPVARLLPRPILRLASRPTHSIIPCLPKTTRLLPPQATTIIRHPRTHHEHYAIVPALAGLSQSFGRAVLTYGRQNEAGNGFGALHIWERHGHEVEAFDVDCVAHIGRFVAEVLVDGTPVFHAPTLEDEDRIAACRRGVGTVILSRSRRGRETLWTVITGYPRVKNWADPLGKISAASVQ